MRHHGAIRFFIRLLWLLLVTRVVEAQSIPITDSRTLGKLILSGRGDINQLQQVLTLSNLYYNRTLNPKNDLDSALLLVKQAEILSLQLNYISGLNDALLLRGKIYAKQQYILNALKIAESLSDTNRIKLLLELGKNNLRPTYSRMADRSKAIAFFRQAETISERINNQKWIEESQCLIGIGYLLSNDWPRGKAYFRQVIEARHRRGDKVGEMKALLRLATTTFCDDCRETMNVLDRALSLARQLGNQGQEMLILTEMGYEHFQLDKGDTKQAEHTALQVLTIQKTFGFKPLTRAYHELAEESVYKMPGEYGYLSNANYFMSDLSQAKGDLNQKLFYILEVVKGVESNNLIEELEYAYFRLGNAYYELGQFDKSMIYHQKSLAISHRKGKQFIQVGLISRMVVTLLKQEKAPVALQLLQDITHKNLPLTYDDKSLIAQSFGACYSALNRYKLAEKYYLESVGLSKRVASQFQYGVWQRISQFYVANGQYTKADVYLSRLLTASQKKIIPSHQIAIQLMLFKVDSARGNYQAAINHYQQYKALNDSIFNEKKSKQIAQLSMQYETDKREQQLRLKEKNIALLTEQSKTQRTQRDALIGGTILLFLLLSVSYNRYRLKQRNNQQLRAQQQVLHTRQEEINYKNTTLQLLLTEKEWLLKEIHHRVKNNLQVVMSLLNAQASYLTDDAALSAIQESQHRVQAMALIHQKLYQSEQVAHISMPTYIQEVVAYLRDSYNLAHPIRFEVQVDPVELDVTQAVPVGLIINEAITNALKYAFPQGHPGTINLIFQRLAPATYKLTITDNGIGLPVGYDPKWSRSLGMTLMQGFSQQLGSELTIRSDPGVSICLLFSDEPLNSVYNRNDYSCVDI